MLPPTLERAPLRQRHAGGGAKRSLVVAMGHIPPVTPQRGPKPGSSDSRRATHVPNEAAGDDVKAVVIVSYEKRPQVAGSVEYVTLVL